MNIKRFLRLCARSLPAALGILLLAGVSCSRADSGASEESSGAAATTVESGSDTAEGTGAAAAGSGAEEAREAIETVLADQAEAWNRGDLEGFMAGYWRSPELTYTAGGSVHRGWEELLDRYRRAYGEGDAMGRLSFDDLEVHPLSEDAAWALGRWRLELEADTLGGAYTLVLREVEGEWRIVHDHTSTDAPPAAPESAP